MSTIVKEINDIKLIHTDFFPDNEVSAISLTWLKKSEVSGKSFMGVYANFTEMEPQKMCYIAIIKP